MIPPNELALRLIKNWSEEKLEPESESSLNNPRDYARFKSATMHVQASTESVDEDAEMPDNKELETTFSSPEDSVFNDGRFVTKTTVHRLYREITDLVGSYEDLFRNMTAGYIIEEHDIEEECENFPVDVNPDHLEASIRGFFERGFPQMYAESYFEINLANRMLPFLTLAQVVIEDYSVSLLNDEIIDEDYRGSNTTMKKLERKLSQPGREMLLQRTGIVSGGFRSDMGNVRQARNDLVHNLREVDYFQAVIEAAKEVETCIEIIKGFEDQLDEGSFPW